MRLNLSSVRIGLALVFLSLLLNIALGILFGADEDLFQNYIKEGIAAHPDLLQARHQAAIWRWFARAHFHAGGIGAYALGLVILTAIANMSDTRKQWTAALIGLSIFYPLAWLAMSILAPQIGTGAAHEHWITLACTYIGVGGLTLGFLSLVQGVFFSGSDQT